MIHLSKGNFDEMVSSGTVLVDFWADWCMPCHMLAPVINTLAEKYADRLLIAKVNVDEEPELTARFEVMSIPTVIIFKDGVPSEPIVGVYPIEAFEQLL